MKQLHMTCGQVMAILYSWLAMSLRSVQTMLPSSYSTILTFTFATISTLIPSDEAIHRHMPGQIFHIQDRHILKQPRCVHRSRGDFDSS